MRLFRLTLILFGVFGLAAVGVGASTTDPDGAPRPARIVIGRPVAVPAHAQPGKPFSVTFAVTRAATGAPVRAGTMICDPSVVGVVIPHTESFRSGIARLAFLVPADAGGKAVTVRLTIRSAGQSSTRVSMFGVQTSPPSVSIGDVSAPEGNEGTTPFSLAVTLSAPARQAVTVDYSTADGSATAPSDYAAATGTVTFGPGETTKPVVVGVVGDPVTEPDETFTVTLSNPRNATLAKSSGTGTIVDDEVVLVSPAADTPVPQNVATIGCSPHFSRGYGFSITFQWKTDHRSDISGFFLRAFHEGATIPIVSTFMPGADATSYTSRSCNAFVADVNLAGWHWSVTATDSQGNPVIWAQGTFSFAPCRLADGAACYAAP
jgi:hypothetical protein